MNTLPPSEVVIDFLMNNGFRLNGFDFYKSIPVTNTRHDWNEEMYVSLQGDGYHIWFPSDFKKEQIVKNDTELIKHISENYL